MNAFLIALLVLEAVSVIPVFILGIFAMMARWERRFLDGTSTLNLRPVFRWLPNAGLALAALSILLVVYLHATGVYRFDWAFAFYALGVVYFFAGIVINVDYFHLLCIRIFVQPSNDVNDLEPDRSSPSSSKPPFFLRWTGIWVRLLQAR